MSEADNHRRWDGKRRGHYEVWYLTCNHRESGTGFWIRYTLESPHEGHGEPYAQLWFACFDHRDPGRTFAINRKRPIAEMTAATDPFAVTIGEARLTHGGMRGAIEGNGHRARWDLHWSPAPRTHRQLPPIMYRRGGLGETTVLTPNLDVPVRGTIWVDGRRLELGGEPGGQTHLWGKKHAHRWAWGHCNAFDGQPGAALETLSVQLERGGRVLPTMTILTLYLDGRPYRWNRFRDVPFTGGESGTGFYRFRATGARYRLDGEFRCRPEDMVVAPYEDPDGEPSYCSNTEVGDLEVTLYERAGLARWRPRAHLLAPGTGHFEVGARERDPAVAKDHVTVP